jgi:hypothetical protein
MLLQKLKTFISRRIGEFGIHNILRLEVITFLLLLYKQKKGNLNKILPLRTIKNKLSECHGRNMECNANYYISLIT